MYGLLAASLTILLGALLLAWRYEGASYADLTPWWNDEWFYWRQAQNWRAAGLESGYFTVSEVTARLGWTPYYTWGPFIVLLHSLGGAGLNSVMLANMGGLLLGSGLGAWAAGANIRRALALALVLALFVPLFLYLPTSYQEVMQYGVALALAGGFARLLSGQTQQRAWLIALILGAALLRSTWAFMLLPAFLIGQPKPTTSPERRARLLRWGLALLLIGLCAIAYSWHGAPYPSFFVWFLANPQVSQLPSLVGRVLTNALTNASGIMVSPYIEEFMQMLQVAALLVLSLRRRLSARSGAAPLYDEWSLHLYQLLLIVLLLILVYGIGNQAYRLIAPHLLLSLALLVWRRRTALALTLVLPALMLLPIFFNVHAYLMGERLKESIAPHMAAWQATFSETLAYQPQADRWCNTVTASWYYVLEMPMIALSASLPQGLGLSWVYWEESFIPQRFRAGYLLLTEDAVQAWADRLNLEPLLDVEGGTLYRNLDADCPS